MSEQDNKRREFRRGFRQFYDFIFRFVSVRLPVNNETEDIVAEVFSRAWRQIDEFDSNHGEMQAWLTGIARHLVADFWRKKEEINIEDVEATISLRNIPFWRALDYQWQLERLLSKLSSASRAILIMRHIDGCSYEEIAEVVGKSPEAVRQVVSRTLNQLRKEVKDKKYENF